VRDATSRSRRIRSDTAIAHAAIERSTVSDRVRNDAPTCRERIFVPEWIRNGALAGALCDTVPDQIRSTENVMSESQSVDTIGALAHLIRATRLQQGFTRDELANATGLSPKFISQVEAGKPTAQIGKVMLLLGELGVRLYAESSVEISEATALKAAQRRRSSHGG